MDSTVSQGVGTIYKIAERFRSIQGEGHFSGVQMDFVRMSQCPVGGKEGICKLWDGTRFVCDTGETYGSTVAARGRTEWHSYTETNERLTAQQIWDASETKHLCLTGGEPFIYHLSDIIQSCPFGKKVHIETSGTVDIVTQTVWPQAGIVWITLSPKEGCLESSIQLANELKLLVHRDTKEEEVWKWLKTWCSSPFDRPFYIQPIEEDVLWKSQQNTQRALELLHLHPEIRLSLQQHKLIGAR